MKTNKKEYKTLKKFALKQLKHDAKNLSKDDFQYKYIFKNVLQINYCITKPKYKQKIF